LDSNYIIAQIIGLLLIVVTFLTPQAKSRRDMLAIILLANLFSCLQFYFVSAKAGLFGLIVTTIRSFVYCCYANKEKQSHKCLLVTFIILQVFATFLGWENWESALTISLVLNTYGQWQTKPQTLRICLLLSAILMGIYCFLTGAYTGALNKWLQAISTVIALWRFKKEKNSIQ
jgi:hypothetical protein